MDTPSCRELNYSPDSAVLFDAIRGMGAPVFLDSARPFSEAGRFDVLAAAPLERIAVPAIAESGPLNSYAYNDYLNCFQHVAQRLAATLSPVESLPEIPFCGGAIGYAGYDLGRERMGISSRSADDIDLPVMAVGIYGWAIVVDHMKRGCWLISHPATPVETLEEVLERLTESPSGSAPKRERLGPLQTNINRETYQGLFERVQRYIHAGDCYQINLARRFEAPFEGCPWQTYRGLRTTAAAPFSAYLESEDGAVLCFSPERFLHLHDRIVRTEPIKGTAPRSSLPEQDRALAQALLDSEKNRAENLMIVDLLRNDLGQCCIPGTIEVEKLFELQSFNTVHHLVSTISGQLREGLSGMDLLAACFPGGSITGAPKKRAMEIIEELEPHRRSIYCGSIFHLGADGSLDSNIAIRTMVCRNNRLYCWSGGGIVADSNVDDEFEETWNKVGRLLDTLG